MSQFSEMLIENGQEEQWYNEFGWSLEISKSDSEVEAELDINQLPLVGLEALGGKHEFTRALS